MPTQSSARITLWLRAEWLPLAAPADWSATIATAGSSAEMPMASHRAATSSANSTRKGRVPSAVKKM